MNLPFAYLVKKLPRRRFIPLTYRFFAVNIFLFAAALHFADPAQTVWVGRVFFIWVSVYNLFVVSVFWQMNVDLFSPEQGKRLFGFIAAGATIGAIVGSALTASLARYVPPTLLLLGAAILLEVAVFASAACRACRRPCTGSRERDRSRARRPPDRRQRSRRHHPRAALALSGQCQPLHAAVRDHLDISLFPASRRSSATALPIAARRPRSSRRSISW